MTSLQQYRSSFIGLDKLFEDLLTGTTSFPPYNIVKASDTEYTIEIAVAGYTKQELEIIKDKNALVITGRKQEHKTEYLYKGISGKAFERKFALADTVKIKLAEYADGLLRIHLFNDVEYKPSSKKIDIQ